MKKCSKCGQELDESRFSRMRNKVGVSVLKPQCKDCCNEANRVSFYKRMSLLPEKPKHTLTEKTCTECKSTLGIEHFTKTGGRLNPDKRSSKCRECFNRTRPDRSVEHLKQREKYAKMMSSATVREPAAKLPETERTCTSCNNTSSIDNFNIIGGRARPDLRASKCKTCFNKERKKTRNTKVEYQKWYSNKIALLPPIVKRIETERMCSCCGKTFGIESFSKTGGRGRPNKRASKCRNCSNIQRRETRDTQHEKDFQKENLFTFDYVKNRIVKGEIHALGQSPKMIERVRDITMDLPDNASWKQRLYHVKLGHCYIEKCAECCVNDVMFMDYKNEYSEFCSKECSKAWTQENKIPNHIVVSKNYNKRHPHIYAWRNVLRGTLQRLKKKKIDHTIKLLGYSAEQLKIHIETQFTDGMSWDNYGKWHVDHKKAVTNFHPDTPMNIVNALDNLQPLWAIDNLQKGNK